MATQDVTANLIRSLLDYDPETGAFTRKYKPKKGQWKIGDRVGGIDAHGYVQINIAGRALKGHRLAWLHYFGEWPSGQIDHINHDRADNRIANLRVTDNAGNHKNRPMQRNNKTGCVGVSWDRCAYVAYITVNGVNTKLGRFADLESAVAARKKAERESGFHENHGDGYGRSKALRLQPGQAKKGSVLVEIDERRMAVTEWAKEPGCTIGSERIRARIRLGWSPRDAVFLPVLSNKEASETRTRRADGTFEPKRPALRASAQ